jgi:hypothetical protein
MTYRYCDIHQKRIDLENDDFKIEDANAVFDIDYDGEKLTAELINVTVGGLRLSREQVSDMIGKDELERQEQIASEAFLEQFRTDPPFGAYLEAAE